MRGVGESILLFFLVKFVFLNENSYIKDVVGDALWTTLTLNGEFPCITSQMIFTTSQHSDGQRLKMNLIMSGVKNRMMKKSEPND